MALLLLPACWGVTAAMWQILKPFRSVPDGSFYFFSGLIGYVAFQWVFFTPMRTYVFGHELTHALAAWLSGGKVKHFHVSKKGGHVVVTKSNIFVSLAPYMFPLYTGLLLLAYFAAAWFYPVFQTYWRLFLLLMGASFGFHLALTRFALSQGQPDLKPSGLFLSAVVIYLGNAFSIVLMLGVLFPKTVSWMSFARTTGQETWTAVRQAGTGAAYVWRGTLGDSLQRN